MRQTALIYLHITARLQLINCFKRRTSHELKTRDCVHDRNTRYKNNLNIPAYKSASGQRTFLYRAMSFCNSLPREIRECDNLPIFKRHLKEFLSSF